MLVRLPSLKNNKNIIAAYDLRGGQIVAIFLIGCLKAFVMTFLIGGVKPFATIWPTHRPVCLIGVWFILTSFRIFAAKYKVAIL